MLVLQAKASLRAWAPGRRRGESKGDTAAFRRHMRARGKNSSRSISVRPFSIRTSASAVRCCPGFWFCARLDVVHLRAVNVVVVVVSAHEDVEPAFELGSSQPHDAHGIVQELVQGFVFWGGGGAAATGRRCFISKT